MIRRRVTLTVTVDCDPVPGAFHDPEDVALRVYGILNNQIGHYRPLVELESVEKVSVSVGSRVISSGPRHRLSDGTLVVLGMRVKDYDCKYGVIIADGVWGEENARQLLNPHESRATGRTFPKCCNAWFHVLRDDGTHGTMDCSRMIAEPRS